jgi:hypothetical protein
LGEEYLETVDLALQLGGLVGDVLDQGEAELVLEVGLPELLVVVDVRLEVRIHQVLPPTKSTPAVLVSNPPSSSPLMRQLAAIAFTRSSPCRNSCYISVRSFSSPSCASSSFPNNISKYYTAIRSPRPQGIGTICT